MKKFLLTVLASAAAVIHAVAAFNLTASKVTVQDLTVDKDNFFVTVEASTSTGEYEVAFDVWPKKHSAIGHFSAADGTITYVSCYVHKTKANGSSVNMWYYSEEDATIELNITEKSEGVCTLSGTIDATRNGTTYTYIIGDFDFAYTEDGSIEPEPDPYRFEPTVASVVDFSGDMVNFRQRDGYIEVTLNEMANETYDWIELRLLSDELAMPAGTYTIDNSGNPGTLTASKGYLGGTKGDDPCYVAIRGDLENWGQYTPYYLESGALQVSYNAKGDTIFVTGEATSHNGSKIRVNVRSYNMLYVDDQPPVPEDVTLGIDTVVITYMSNLSDTLASKFVYTFNFSRADDYPTVLTDVVMTKPMELVAGTYTLENGLLSGVQLAQNQSDFEENLFMGGAYNFTDVTLSLAQEDGSWRYTMEMHDDIGSTYRFSMVQQPHIILYPQPSVDPKEQPFTAESKTVSEQSFMTDTLIWKDETVEKDGIIDIILSKRLADADGTRPYIQLGMYTNTSKPAAGSYPVNGSEEDGTFSASLGQYGNVLIPCFAAIANENGYANQLWFIVSGTIHLSYDEAGKPVLSGECTSYYGSTIRFTYQPQPEGLEEVQRNKVQSTKALRDGQIIIIRNGKTYNVSGQKVE